VSMSTVTPQNPFPLSFLGAFKLSLACVLLAMPGALVASSSSSTSGGGGGGGSGDGEWYWDNDTGNRDWDLNSTDDNNWDSNDNPTTIGGVTPKVFFTDDYVGSDQFIDFKIDSQVVHSMTFRGKYKYTIDDTYNDEEIVFDSGVGGGSSYINIEASAWGSDNHEIWVEMTLNNDLEINQEVNRDFRIRDQINLNNNTLTFNNVGTVRTQDDITGTGNLVKNNTGTVKIQGATTFTGDVTVNAGTMKLQHHDSLEEVSNVIVNGGTLLEECSFAINDDANMILAGGTYELAGGVDETMNSLTLTDDSTIKLGSGNNTLTYESGTHSSGMLTIDNWDGLGTGGGNDQVIFNTTLSSDFLSNVHWADQGITGAVQLGTGEIVPIPEPATMFMGFGVFSIAVRDFLRRRKSAVSDS